MAKVLHRDASANQLNVSENNAQAYGLKGNDTIVSDGKSDVLLVGGGGDDSLIVMGGEATLSGGDGSDTFELNYSADKKLSAVIEDLQPSQDKIVVNFDGSTTPQLTSVRSGSDVVWQDDDGLFNVTLKSVRDNDYFDDEASEQVWQVLELTNTEREAASLSPLTMSQGLMTGASIRVEESAKLGKQLKEYKHTRPNDGGDYKTVFDEIGKKYHYFAENLTAGEATAQDAVNDWMNSTLGHREIILTEDFKKLGAGYNYYNADSYGLIHYWEQLFADSLTSDSLGNPETVTAEELLTASISSYSVSKFIAGDDEPNTIQNNLYGVTIDALGGNDSVDNSGLNVSISGGADDDTILSSGSFATIAGNTGNDLISLSSDAQKILIEYAAGDGFDTISGLHSTDTLSISGNVEFTPETVDNDIIVGVGSDSITLLGAASSGVQIEGVRSKLILGTENDDYLENTVAAASILAKGGNDTIDNSGANVSIYSGTGDDSVYNRGSNVLFFHESGNDTIGGFDETSTLKIADGSLSSVTIGNDLILTIFNGSIKILGAASLSPINIVDANDSPVEIGDAKDVRGTEQADNLSNAVDGATIRALGGDDTIENSGDNVSIYDGAGDDYVNNNCRKYTWYTYESGNDTIEGFTDLDRLNLKSYAWETLESGTNIIVSIIDDGATVGTVTLKDYSSDQYINIISSYVPYNPGENISNSLDSTLIAGTSNDDTIENTGYNVTILGLAGFDSIESFSYNVTIDGGAGSDFIYNQGENVSIDGGSSNDYIWNDLGNSVTINGGKGNDEFRNDDSQVSIDAGEGNDYIVNWGDTVSIDAGEGDDFIGNGGDWVTINGGVGNDSIESRNGNNVKIDGGDGEDSINNGNYAYDAGDNITIDGGDGDDYIRNNGASASINAGDGNDHVNSYGSNVSIDGGKGNDYLSGGGSNDSIYGGDGNDSIHNGSADASNVTISGGDGNDVIFNLGSNASINGGAGDDRISTGLRKGSVIIGHELEDRNSFAKYVSILGGTGNDQIRLQSDSENFIRYADGDGNDTIWGFDENDTLNFLADESSSSSIYGGEGDNDIIYFIGEGSVTLKDARNKPLHITWGESGTSGGSGSGGGSGGGTSSSGSSGSSGQSGGNTSGGTSASANSNSDASGGQSASGSSGTSASSGGNGSSGRGNSSSTAGSSILDPITIPENLSTTSTTRTRTTTNYNPFNTSVTTTQGTYSGNIMSPIERIYSGGNKIIKHYGSWRKITFDEIYRGAHFDGSGNFIVESSTGHLVFENATDKVINLKDAAGNDFIKAHMSSTAGTVDGRIYSGYQILNGSLGEDLIFAGADGSQLWGNADTASDTLVGGDGSDIFVGGKNEGSDTFQNASSADVINLNDTSLSDIVSANVRDGALVISFNTGNTLTVQSTEALSANIIFSDGANRRFNHATNSWQTE